MKMTQKNLEKIGIIFSILFSFIATIISIKSCCNSNEALEISQKEFRSKRQLVFESKQGNTFPAFLFSPLDANQKVQSITVYLPARFNNDSIIIEPPEFEIYLSQIEDSLSVIFRINSFELKIDDQRHSFHVYIPIVVKTSYVVGGENLLDIAFYYLKFTIRRDPFNELAPIIDFNNLAFSEKWVKDDHFNEALNDLWNKALNDLIGQIKRKQ